MTNKFYTKLDRRHKGFGDWTYLISRPVPNYIKAGSLLESKQQFYKWREWCWSTWGSSKEIDRWLEDYHTRYPIFESQNAHWCWQNDEYESRIYLRGDPELSIFLLRWGT